MKNITEEQLDFKTFERRIFEIMCMIACELMRQYLEWRDLAIMALRDKEEYKMESIRVTTVKTLMGEVSFNRRYYKRRSGGYVFLLDEAMGLDSAYGLVSENLAEQIVIECSEKSFRKAAGSVCNLTGQTISAMGAWGVLQKFGKEIGCQEERLRELDTNGSTGHLGNISAPVLMNEYDDVWLAIQKETREKKGTAAIAVESPPKEGTEKTPEKKPKKSKKKPIHVGIAYTGWEQAKDGRYGTKDKIAYASFGSPSAFTSSFETLLRHRFDMDGVERRITNGDGESWIRTAAEENDSVLQLNPYHRSKAIIKAVRGKEDRNRLFEAIAEKDVGKVLDITYELYSGTTEEKALKRIGDLYNYFSNNSDIFLTWQERGMELPEPAEGVSYRSMGVQESSNCSLITLRMKHRRGSWSENGADNMGRILCIRNTIGLDAILGPLPEPPGAEPWLEPLSAAKTPQYDGKGYGADWLYAEMPFEHAFRTNGREAIRGMFRMRPLSELTIK